MFHILILGKDMYLKNSLEAALSENKLQVTLTETADPGKARFYLNHIPIDLFVVSVDINDTTNLRFAVNLRKREKYAFTPILVYSTDLDFLHCACRKIYCCGYLVKSSLKEDLPRVIQFINYNLHHTCYGAIIDHYIELDLPSNYCRILTDEILFIESRDRKCIIHTFQEELSVPYPIKKLLELAPPDSLVQSHRSFLINLHNIKKIDKSVEPWIVSFVYSEKQALISRNYKKSIQCMLSETL